MTSNGRGGPSIAWPGAENDNAGVAGKRYAGFLLLGVLLVLPLADAKAQTVPSGGIAERVLHQVFQPTAAAFAQSADRLLGTATDSCKNRTPVSLDELQKAFETSVEAFSALELFRTGPLLVENRRNRIFYWPDKRRVGERQMRALLAESEVAALTPADIAGKSVALQGFPALERLVYGIDSDLHFTTGSDAPDCRVAAAIAANVASMADAIRTGWQEDSAQVRSLLKPEAESEFYRTEEEVHRGIVTQILVGVDVILNRKIAALTGDDAALDKAPLWRSGLTLHMLRANLDSMRALTLDSGLAAAAHLENELAFEFRTADQMLQKLLDLHELTDEAGEFTDDANSLLRSLQAVVGGIRYTLNDRFVTNLGISAGFNSEDGD